MIKKAVNISIAQRLFSIEEDAYVRLDAYLESVRAHFLHTEGRDEIIADIESRIAEQLSEAKEQVLSLHTVEKVLVQMGTTEDFEDADRAESAGNTTDEVPAHAGQKRLYRNPDDKFIAGVCSGLGAYFGVDPVWMRLLLIVATLFNGLGLVVYLVLWMVVPEAKSRAQKLEMAGSPVNLETISETVRERIAEIPADSSSRLAKVLALPFRIIGTIITSVLRILGPVLRISVGVALVLGSMLLLVAVLVAGSFFSSKELWISNDTPLLSILPQPLYFFGILGAVVAVLVPLVFVLLGGISLLQRKNMIHAVAGFSLVGAWFVALVLSGFSVATAVSNYQEFVSVSPAYAQVTEDLPVEGRFTALHVSRGITVEIVESDAVSLRATGRAKDMELVSARVENGTLLIERTDIPQKIWCIACGFQTPRLTLEVPVLRDISLTRGSSVVSAALPTGDTFVLSLDDGSYADLALQVREASVTANDGSRAVIRGVAAAVELSLDNGSWIEAQQLKITDATATLSDGSRAQLNVAKTLEVTATRGSHLTYIGAPEVTQFIDRGSYLHAVTSARQAEESP